ncbi:hypothetical protein, partial [Flagellimonas olearia]
MLSLCKKTSLFPSTGPSRIYILFWAFLFFGLSVGYGQIISIDDPAPVAEGNAGTATLTFTVTLDVADLVND